MSIRVHLWFFLSFNDVLTSWPEIAERFQQEAAMKKRSFKQIVNDALAQELGIMAPTKCSPYRVKPHTSPILPRIDSGKLNQLVDELEAQEFVSAQTLSPA